MHSRQDYGMRKITRLEIFVIGDGPEIDPDKGGVEPLACLRVHTDDGLVGLSKVFRVPPGVVQATVRGPDTHSGACCSARRSRIPNGCGSMCGTR